jgi:hypothetical protein
MKALCALAVVGQGVRGSGFISKNEGEQARCGFWLFPIPDRKNGLLMPKRRVAVSRIWKWSLPT